MKNLLVVFGLLPLAYAFGEGKKNLTLFTAIDFGRLENGYDMRLKYDPSGLALNQTYVDVGFNQQLDEHYLINIGVGGLFWKAFEGNGGTAADKAIKFGPGISSAYMKWTPNKQMGFTFGYFPYKYNQSATNLGEYLFRTEAYPTIVYTGGWSWMNDVQYHALGAMFSWNLMNEKLKLDAGLFGEYFNAPIYDISPAAIATWKPLHWLTAGGAVSLHRFISPTPKVTDELTKPYTYYENFYIPAVPEDTATVEIEAKPAQTVTMLKDDIITLLNNDRGGDTTSFLDPNNVPSTVSFDLAAIKAVAFFDLNLNGLLGLSEEKMGRFNLYGEVAQLGFNNYPIFYTKNSQRMPMMLGFSVPTFGVLDHLSFEVERLENPNIESIRSTFDKLDLPPDEDFRYKSFSRDDLKWSVHAGRSLTKFLTLYIQFANDHLRLKDAFARPQFIPVTNEPSHWYWLTRIQWMI